MSTRTSPHRTPGRTRKRNPTRARAKPAASRERLSAGERREQLLRTAGKLVAREGIDALELTRLAAEAGVSRPIVYRFFPNRQALIMGILEDLEAELVGRFKQAARGPIPADIPGATRLFIDAVCDAIEAKGVGPWELLGSKGPDREVAKLAQKIHLRLMAPWVPRVARATGAGAREAETVARMLVAAGRAVLEQWYTGAMSRDEAARQATRGVSALLAAFSRTA
jgi:AcrR family transcriptional regulator